MPGTELAALVTDGFRAQLAVVRDDAADQVQGLLESEISFDSGQAALARSLVRWSGRSDPIVTAAAEQAAEMAMSYLKAYLNASGLDEVLPLVPALADDLGIDLEAARSALLWRLGRGDGRAAALQSASGVAVRVTRTAIAQTTAANLSAGMAAEPGITKWRRVTSRTCCQRCAVLTTREYPSTTPFFLRHPADRCTPEPVALGVVERFLRTAPLVVAA